MSDKAHGVLTPSAIGDLPQLAGALDRRLLRLAIVACLGIGVGVSGAQFAHGGGKPRIPHVSLPGAVAAPAPFYVTAVQSLPAPPELVRSRPKAKTTSSSPRSSTGSAPPSTTNQATVPTPPPSGVPQQTYHPSVPVQPVHPVRPVVTPTNSSHPCINVAGQGCK